MNNPIFSAGILVITTTSLVVNGCKPVDYDNIPSAGREPVIEPDYMAVTIPKNIAPMNFIVLEGGNSYIIRAKSLGGTRLTKK